MKFKKMLTLTAIALSGFGLVACGNQSAASKQSTRNDWGDFTENGSGTQGAFTEITGILKDSIKKLTTLPKQLWFKIVQKVFSQQFKGMLMLSATSP